jgi:regulator of replication initiation timing
LEEKITSLTQHNEKLIEKTQHLNIEITTLKKNFEDERKDFNEKLKVKDAKIE